MKLEFHPSTVNDVNDAATYYERQRPGLGAEYLHEVDAALRRLEAEPFLFPPVDSHLRRCVVHRFPYTIVFRVLDRDVIRVLLIRHHRRDPRFGIARK